MMSAGRFALRFPRPMRHSRARTYSSQTRNPLRILMLHGFAQSSDLFEQKTVFIRDELCHASRTAATLGARDIQFTFIDAPFKLKREALPSFDLDGAKQDDPNEDLEAYTWWHLTGRSQPFVYKGLDIALNSIAKTIQTEGPFDGIIGFSQGAALAVMVASLLEHGRKDAFDRAEPSGSMPYPPAFITRTSTIKPPLKFVIAMSGFAGVGIPLYQAFYHPKIVTPTLHLLGEQDDFIKPTMSRGLIDSCAESQVLYHSGGHRVPRQADFETGNGLLSALRMLLEK